MKLIKKEQLTFDDVLMMPQYSEVKSRSDIDVSVSLSKGFKFNSPIVPANMKLVVGDKMAQFFIKNKNLVLLHRFTMEDQFNMVKALNIRSDIGQNINNYFGVSLGIKEEDEKYAARFYDLGVRIFCVDVAHCDNKYSLNFVNNLAKRYSNCLIIAGNVATGEAANRVWDAGADICKVGIGGSMVCTTRTQTGCGVPTLSSLFEVAEVLDKRKDNVHFMADGGIRTPSDASKCFAAGASMIMMGGVLAGTSLSPGEIVELNGKKYKRYEGSSTYKDRIEGVKALKEYEGETEDVLNNFYKGIQSSCSYQGVNKLSDLHKVAIFTQITNASIKESYPHDVIVLK